MKKLVISLFAFILAFSGPLAMAKDVKILKVSSNVDNEVSDLILVTNEEDKITGLKLAYRDGNKAAALYNIRLLKREIVLKEVDGHKVITISSDDFDFNRGGHIEMSYLYNGLRGSRKEAEFKVQLENTGWKVYYDGKRVNSAHFKGRYWVGKLVGIKSVTFK